MKKYWQIKLITISCLLLMSACSSSLVDTEDSEEGDVPEISADELDERVLSFTQSFLTSLVSSSSTADESVSGSPELNRFYLTTSPADGFTIDFSDGCTDATDSEVTYSGCVILYSMEAFRASTCETTSILDEYILMEGNMEGGQSGIFNLEADTWTSLNANLSDAGLILTLVDDTLDPATGEVSSSISADYTLEFDLSVSGYSGADSRTAILSAMDGTITITGDSGYVTLTGAELADVLSGDSCDYVP